MLGFSANMPGQPRMLDVLRAGLRGADHVCLSVAFLRFSGLQLLVADLKDFAERGGTARVLTSTYLGVTQPEALHALAEMDGVAVKLHTAQAEGARGFHPKFVLFRRGHASEAWVGSSNLTKGGLCTNVEANIRQRDPALVDEVAATFEALWNDTHSHDLSSALTDAYARALLRQMAIKRERATLAFALAPEDQTLEPNAAQREALVALERLRQSGETKAVVIAAPGVGKTYLAAFDARQAQARTLLFLSHRLEHLTQAQATFASLFGERYSTGLLAANHRESTADFVFATVQSARNSETLIGREFDYVVVDEFHHAAADSYRALLEQLAKRHKFLLGLTATPERQDGHDVIAICDYNVAYEVRLVEAINRDWLVPFHYFGIADETVDYTKPFWRRAKLETAQVEMALMLQERVDHILAHAQRHGYDGLRRATVAFCAGRNHAHFMAKALLDRGLCAAVLTGEDDLRARKEVFANFEDPDHPLEWLFVADLLNEGVDIPSINSLLFLRPTESATLFIQQLGRGLRLSEHCDVLTVLDFVGHHRNAWLTVDALADRSAPPGPTTERELDLTPPKHCEVVLDRKTIEILRKVRSYTTSKADRCREAYRSLKRELERPPFPVDLLARRDLPELGEFRTAFGSWLDLRVQQHDATEWEKALGPDSPAHKLFAAAERDWQQQRVYAYALLWGLCDSPEAPEQGYERFFERFPRWRVERVPLGPGVWTTLEKRLPGLLADRRLLDEIRKAVPPNELLRHVEQRLQYTLERDFKLRHGGVLRTPQELVLHRGYHRPVIVNHYGEQYDPTRHNQGVLTFDEHGEIMIISKLDTSHAKADFQYVNELEGDRLFHWQSQNRQQPDSGSGAAIVNHAQRGITLRLFVQRSARTQAIHLGPVKVVRVSGAKPMNVTFELMHRIPAPVLAMLR